MAAISKLEYNPSRWLTITFATFAFWISASLILDFVIMPTMYVSGMMEESGFASAGSMIFSLFNRVELVCAALGLTGLMAFGMTMPEGFSNRIRTVTLLAVGLVAISFIYTYTLTPQMIALGVHLNLFTPVTSIPIGMNQLHISYFSLEVVKLTIIGLILNWCYQNRTKVSCFF